MPVLRGLGDNSGAVSLKEIVEGAELGVDVFGFVRFSEGARGIEGTQGPEFWDHVVILVEKLGDGSEVGIFGQADGIGAHDFCGSHLGYVVITPGEADLGLVL
jgi:hypothetical protein